MKKIWLWIWGFLIIALVALGVFMGPTLAKFMSMTRVDLDPQLKAFIGGGGNSLVLVSEDGKEALVVDTKIGPPAKRLKAYVDSLGPETHVTVVNTHYHPDHAGGNPLYPKAKIIAGAYPDAEWQKVVKDRLPDEKVPVGAEKVIPIGSETVRILNLGQAHTTNDLVVYFVNRKLLHTGDLLFNHWNPVLKSESGANVGKWILALETILKTFDLGKVVPGHGPITDKGGLQEMHDYFASIYAAAGDKQKLSALKEKYRGYFSLLGMSGFDQTVAYVEKEKQGGQ
jgi:glyoxylase-like metal-dependent hydrolase (beta-lactamase superfamily II)